jgi:hypothetical protein
VTEPWALRRYRYGVEPSTSPWGKYWAVIVPEGVEAAQIVVVVSFAALVVVRDSY